MHPSTLANPLTVAMLGELEEMGRANIEFAQFDPPVDMALPPAPPRLTSDFPEPELAGQVVVSAIDLEPASSLLLQFALNHIDELKRSIEWLGQNDAVKSIRFALHRGPGDVLIKKLRGAAEKKLRFVRFDVAYPLGHALVIGRELRAASVIDVVSLIDRHQRLERLPVVVVDHIGGTRRFLSVPVGASVASLVAGVTPTLIVAGAAMAERFIDPDVQIHACGELVFHVLHRIERRAEPCIRCGWCVEICPVGCHPAELLDAVAHRDAARADRFGLDACVECGLCTRVCPSRLPLAQEFIRARHDPLRTVGDEA